MITLYASGTQSTTGSGTEDFLSSPNVAGRFQLQLDLNDMASGDVIEVRVYKMTLTGGTARVAYYAMYSGAQPANAKISISDAIANTVTDANAVRFSITQTFGTAGISIPWAVYNIEDWTSTATPPPVNVTQVSGDSTAADNAEAFFDGTGYAGTNNVIPTVTNLTNAPTNGDLTATMKTSVTTAASSSTPALSTAGNAAVADKLLGRSIAGGADGGRTVSSGLSTLRNKQEIAAGVYTCYEADDVTPLFEANVTTAAGNPMSAWDPTT